MELGCATPMENGEVLRRRLTDTSGGFLTREPVILSQMAETLMLDGSCRLIHILENQTTVFKAQRVLRNMAAPFRFYII